MPVVLKKQGANYKNIFT